MSTRKSPFFKKAEISLASPKAIEIWTERYFPNGQPINEVTSSETVNYKTLKPEPHGLFCQTIFGPVVDFTCACGKKATKLVKNKKFRGYCPKCGVERTSSRVRRYRLGLIKLKQPVAHSLYVSHRPSPLRLCLGWSTKRLQAVLKAVEFCYLPLIFTTFQSERECFSFFPKSFLLLRSQLTQKNEVFLEPRSSGFNENLSSSFFFKEKKRSKRKTGKVFPLRASPRLFHKKHQKNRPRLVFNHGVIEARLYGIAYDATWPKVEEFQEFLFYLWEQSFFYESSIPYYAFAKGVKSYKEEIPKLEQSYALQTGGLALQQILSHHDSSRFEYDLIYLSKKVSMILEILKENMASLNLDYEDDQKEYKKLLSKVKKLDLLLLKWKRQRELYRDFEVGKTQPAWMILNNLPVLPPGLRPITSIGGLVVASDINSFYRKIIIRNKRMSPRNNLGIFDTTLGGSWLSWCYNLRQVQEAVDELLRTGSVDAGRPLKSLLDGLKGKKGRFRQHLLGKRVDYSGRSVIVVGPKLKLHQCGLPKEMAVELFQPFIIQQLRLQGIVFTVTAAKVLIADRKPIVWSVLGEILKTHPVLLNRAPTLHRLGIQAFLPRLVEGKAILLHPLVCPAFNADFDGDQMAVHVPLSAKTRAEALSLLWSRNQLLAPSSGQPLLLPTQDMVLGFYYLTCSLEKTLKRVDSPVSSRKLFFQSSFFLKKKNEETLKNSIPQNLYFSEFSQVKTAYDIGNLTLHTPIWVKWTSCVQTFVPERHSRLKETLLETRLTFSGQRQTLFIDTCQFFSPSFFLGKKVRFIRTTPGRIFMHWCFFEANAEMSSTPTSKEKKSLEKK